MVDKKSYDQLQIPQYKMNCQNNCTKNHHLGIQGD